LVCLAALHFAPEARAQSRRQAPARTAEEKQEVLNALAELKVLIQEQRRELTEQRGLLKEQAEKIASLERLLREQRAAAEAVPKPPDLSEDVRLLEGQLDAVAESQNALAQRVATVQTEMTTAGRAADGRFRQVGNFRFSGDLRYRYEPFLQDQQTTRQRQRVRARFNLQGNITNTLFGGVTFATGSLDDPISTNQTLGVSTGFFNRKQVGFDRAWIQWTPKKLVNGHVTFGLGKFAFPWIRTPLTFDSDLNPEGLYTRLNWDFKNSLFKGITVVGFHLPFLEHGGSTSATTGVRADGLDAFIAGGQVQTRWKFGDRLTLGLNIAGLNFVNADFIAQAHSTSAVTTGLAGQLTGNSPITNALRTNASGQTVGYASRFTYLDTIATLGVDTGYARWPLNITFDFNNNLRATRIIQNGTAAPTGRVDNPERSAYWTEFQFGRLGEARDIQFGYVFARIERDAVIGAFNESDFRAGSNLSQHRLNFYYRWFSNVTLSYQLWLGHVVNAADNIALIPGGKRAVAGGPCNAAPFTGCTDNTLKRMQFDFIYSF
jgi:hypothetical protein